MNNNQNINNSSGKEFTLFAWWRVAVALIAAVLVLWIVLAVAGRFKPSPDLSGPEPGQENTALPADEETRAEPGSLTGRLQAEPDQSPEETTSSGREGASAGPETAPESETAGASERTTQKPSVKGMAFVNALIKPLSYELNERFWGWRPNDVIEYTDNVNNMQRGILEVTRRATVSLAERLSRTGSTDELDPNLESAMNWFMIKADSFWFPSAEKKYSDGLEEIRQYGERLSKGQANFYTRADNLIPLIESFASLLGSCDENLVKQVEKDGEPVSTFAADNYFYYAKGVAGAMVPILEAGGEEFHDILATRGAEEILHNAIHACEVAASLDPWIVLESDLDSLLANHRANMAAHISHARFYLDVLAKTLST